MSKRVGLEISLAIAEAVKLADTDMIAAYPITPQTHIVERLAEMVAEGELKAAYINAESEHSAISLCVGSSIAGARTFTATSAQGLALMHEIMYITAALRLPIVMVVVNRAMSGPLSIWGDHSDVMGERDTGWIQLFAQNGQEAFDMTLQAFRIAEDHRVLLPVIVNIDGFTLSHVIEPIEILDQTELNKFMRTFKPKYPLDPRRPLTFGAFAIPEYYMEAKKQVEQAIFSSKAVIEEVWQEFDKLYGRHYTPIESYKTEDAKILLLTLGGIGETAQTAVDEMREQGIKVGLLKLVMYRPFPIQELRDACKAAQTLVICERAMSIGGQGGPIGFEVRSAFYNHRTDLQIHDIILGLGGRDVKVDDFKVLVKHASEKKPKEYELIGVRE
ncbi:MAG: pyruvate ferredoxin oxidoreductase [Candidatus Latescibacteria bacterium]|nr:pyruvate ferredoxin oxidoreductase [Candidatus Latescibacterota bacterium]